MNVFPAGFFHSDEVAGFHLKRGNIDFPVVNENVTVIDQLSGLTAGSGKTSAIDSVVQPSLEQLLLLGLALVPLTIAAALVVLTITDPNGLPFDVRARPYGYDVG